jgi:hypothetical protein
MRMRVDGAAARGSRPAGDAAAHLLIPLGAGHQDRTRASVWRRRMRRQHPAAPSALPSGLPQQFRAASLQASFIEITLPHLATR